MWLRPPNGGSADNIRDPRAIADLQQKGWVEVAPVWMRHASGAVLYVTHPEHQKRLLNEGATITTAPDDEATETETAAPARSRK